jgi:hypothetical protein
VGYLGEKDGIMAKLKESLFAGLQTNYVANDEALPTEVIFQNGRKVSVVMDYLTGDPILEIGWGEYPDGITGEIGRVKRRTE